MDDYEARGGRKMPANEGAAQWLRSSKITTTVVIADGRCTGVIDGAGTVTEVHGQLVHNEEQPHGTPSGHASSLPPVHSAATSALATDIMPLIVASRATTKSAWSMRGT